MASREQRGNKEKKKPKAAHNQKNKGKGGAGAGTPQAGTPNWSPQGAKK